MEERGWPRWVVPAVWIGLLFGICYWPVIQSLVSDWSRDEDMGHGFFVPPVALYFAWLRRSQFEGAPFRTNMFGLLVLAAALLILVVGTLGVELFLQRFSLIVALTGMVLFAGGTSLFRILAFPLFLLIFMIPLPALIYSQVTFPLQILASRVAEACLMAIGIPVLREGNLLELPSKTLSVVEACSGIRSLLSLSFLGLVYGEFFDNRAWMKWALLLVTVPVAVVANASRVTITGILTEINPELAEGLFHSLEGWVIFLVTLTALVIIHRGICWALAHKSSSVVEEKPVPAEVEP